MFTDIDKSFGYNLRNKNVDYQPHCSCIRANVFLVPGPRFFGSSAKRGDIFAAPPAWHKLSARIRSLSSTMPHATAVASTSYFGKPSLTSCYHTNKQNTQTPMACSSAGEPRDTHNPLMLFMDTVRQLLRNIVHSPRAPTQYHQTGLGDTQQQPAGGACDVRLKIDLKSQIARLHGPVLASAANRPAEFPAAAMGPENELAKILVNSVSGTTESIAASCPISANAIPIPLESRPKPTSCYFVIDCHQPARTHNSVVSTKSFLKGKTRARQKMSSADDVLLTTVIRNPLETGAQAPSLTRGGCPLRLHTACEIEVQNTGYDADTNNNLGLGVGGDCLFRPKNLRQRSFSECSDESFICFMDEDDGEKGHCREMNADFDDEEANENDDNSSSSFSSSDAESSFLEDSDDNGDETDASDDGFLRPSALKHNTGENIRKKVRFNLTPKVHNMHTWSFAYRSARKGNWEDYARDRTRFQQRIQRTAVYLDPILSSEHRTEVYKNRFANQK